MESVRVKSYAKLNLTLHITGKQEGYHCLDSLVTSVDMYDAVTVKKRRDNLVSVTMRGMGSESISFESNNAVKAAQLFIDKYGTRGADIKIDKNIPMGLGMGGSSADAAGVLNALFSLYKIDDVAGKKLLADECGSDTRYMLTGGYARLFGRGNEVREVDSKLKLNFLLLAPKEGVSTAECYKTYDSAPLIAGDSNAAEEAVISCDKHALATQLFNGLQGAAEKLSDDISVAASELKAFDPLAVCMTGSGSGVYALFENYDFCAYAKSRYGGAFRAVILKTVIPKR